MPVACPSLAGQRAIADYLDTQTARIDALINKKRRMIDLIGGPRSDELFHLVALVVTASILAHSSTDVVIARRFEPGTGPDATDSPPARSTS